MDIVSNISEQYCNKNVSDSLSPLLAVQRNCHIFFSNIMLAKCSYFSALACSVYLFCRCGKTLFDIL